ncbi:unnamed protein product [Caenorhabditis angaria]|uniref:DUF7773 domain-containing protein n=1 Tax=Caenorhabditis angaria TaxID=860376 RepID=A0A9P1N1K5_9PELO|nr:unnamed protein product [Caenorhabditis angaria]
MGSFYGVFGDPLTCYDNNYYTYSDGKKCDEGQICYSEFYAVNRTGDNSSLEQNYARYCIWPEYCVARGIDDKCSSIEELDWEMQEAFQNHSGVSISIVPFSQFCCCKEDFCNDVNPIEVHDKFGILLSPENMTDSSNQKSILLSILILYLTIIFL